MSKENKNLIVGLELRDFHATPVVARAVFAAEIHELEAAAIPPDLAMESRGRGVRNTHVVARRPADRGHVRHDLMDPLAVLFANDQPGHILEAPKIYG